VEFLTELWLPIVVSGAVVFILSALAWTVLPHHKSDWQGLPNADAVQLAMRAHPPTPGQYALPWARDPKMLQDPAMKERMDKGPRAFITVVPNGMPGMGPMMVKSFIYNVVVSLLVAYVAWHALGAGAPYRSVFRIAGATSMMSYILAAVPESIWFGRPWRTFGMQVVDGVVFGLFTAGVFGWLWP
jgi:hypothetical protein